jgi:hypothetical protein
MTDSTKVVMVDGREVNFGKKQKLDKEILRDAENSPSGVRIGFKNGSVVTVMFEDIPANVLEYAKAHGLVQKLGDEAASADDVDEAEAKISALAERLKAGQWTGAGGGIGFDTILVAALQEFSGMTREDVIKTLREMKPNERQALKADESIKPIYDRMETEKAKGVDSSALLAKFATKA